MTDLGAIYKLTKMKTAFLGKAASRIKFC